MMLLLLKFLAYIALHVGLTAGIVAIGLRNGKQASKDNTFSRRYRWVMPTYCIVATIYVIATTFAWPGSIVPLVVLGIGAAGISIWLAETGRRMGINSNAEP